MNKTTDHGIKRAEMDQLITAIELPELNKQFLRARWLEQIMWMEEKALDALWWYRVLRLATIIGGVIVPALVSWTVGDGDDMLKALTFIVSLVVALSAAVEEFFRYGERWRHYRRTVESLKSEGWQFLQLSGPYVNMTHSQAYPAFATRVEELSREEVDRYMTQVAKDKKEEDRIPSTT
jgi:hypothetical protein